MLKQIDLTNLNHITFIIILIIIFFCIIYLFKVNKHNASIEGFKQYDVNIDDAVKLYSLDNIIVGGNGESLITTLNDAYADRRDYLINKQSIVNQLDKFKTDILLNMNNIKTDIESNVRTFRTTITSNTDASISSFETRLTAGITNTPPPLTIVALYNTQIPTGWQLCNGGPLNAVDGKSVFYKTSITQITGLTQLNTPDLRGRIIIGANYNNTDTSNTALTITKICDYGGSEKHTLTKEEMPSHNHTSTSTGFDGSGRDHNFGGTNFLHLVDWNIPTDFTGGNQPHNNMPPVYVLNYIIKKPLLGGDNIENAILIESTNANIALPQRKFINIT